VHYEFMMYISVIYNYMSVRSTTVLQYTVITPAPRRPTGFELTVTRVDPTHIYQGWFVPCTLDANDIHRVLGMGTSQGMRFQRFQHCKAAPKLPDALSSTPSTSRSCSSFSTLSVRAQRISSLTAPTCSSVNCHHPSSARLPPCPSR
jgi:hypothetical protein